MGKTGKIIIVLLLGGAVAAVMIAKQDSNTCCPITRAIDFIKSPETSDSETAGETDSHSKRLPRLIDLGSDSCVPCKMMEPVLEELKTEYSGTLDVKFINVRLYPEAAEDYRITLIPTQIFFNAGGEELYRHEGYMSKQDILSKWQELGVDINN
ncbi:MAG: thioredoxin family protein [Sedimentisphaerales bacterium]|nr:thioredoxin family protein [Sedimentisphaerales bacterium]